TQPLVGAGVIWIQRNRTPQDPLGLAELPGIPKRNAACRFGLGGVVIEVERMLDLRVAFLQEQRVAPPKWSDASPVLRAGNPNVRQCGVGAGKVRIDGE